MKSRQPWNILSTASRNVRMAAVVFLALLVFDTFKSIAPAQSATEVPAAAGSNLLPNPGFELDLSADRKPDGWRSSDWGTGSKVAWDTSAD